jgi:hypothetical protein
MPNAYYWCSPQGQWNMKIRKDDYLAIPALMKLYMELDKFPVIPHMIEEVLVF